jgi:hypothetical protein
MSDDRFHRRARVIWFVIVVCMIVVLALELLGVRPK